MTDKIINYISETPENTNPAVLHTLLGDLNKQSDWNQNDKTQPDYVKNRPFYTGDLVETEIVPQITVTFSEMAGMMGSTLLESFDAVEGQTYTISWDGTDYVCTCILYNGGQFFGNLGVFGFGDDTGEPFTFVHGEMWEVYTTESETEHVIGITGNVAPIAKIDKKYLPKFSEVLPEPFWEKYPKEKLIEICQEFNNGKVFIYSMANGGASLLLYAFYYDTVGFRFVFTDISEMTMVQGSPGNWTKSSFTYSWT